MVNNINEHNNISKSSRSNEELIMQIISIRTAVLALGEAVEPAWWRTKFMNEVGLRFLDRLYPRTSFMAALHAAGKAACDTHDRAVGKVGAYHLFRLPEMLETAVQTTLKTESLALLNKYGSDLDDQVKLLEHLKSAGDAEIFEGNSAGALNIGTEMDLDKVNTFKKAAAIYYTAFQQKMQVFPYLSIDRSRRSE